MPSLIQFTNNWDAIKMYFEDTKEGMQDAID